MRWQELKKDRTLRPVFYGVQDTETPRLARVNPALSYLDDI